MDHLILKSHCNLYIVPKVITKYFNYQNETTVLTRTNYKEIQKSDYVHIFLKLFSSYKTSSHNAKFPLKYAFDERRK